MNAEGITYEKALNLRLIWSFTNGWRQRRVDILEHPSDSLKVVTVGTPIGGGQSVVCVEDRSAYDRIIVGRIKRTD